MSKGQEANKPFGTRFREGLSRFAAGIFAGAVIVGGIAFGVAGAEEAINGSGIGPEDSLTVGEIAVTAAIGGLALAEVAAPGEKARQ